VRLRLIKKDEDGDEVVVETLWIKSVIGFTPSQLIVVKGKTYFIAVIKNLLNGEGFDVDLTVIDVPPAAAGSLIAATVA
jgi:hypothetical protein